MCGRYSLIAGADQLALRFDFDVGALNLSPNFNVAPSQSVLTVRAAEGPGAERRNREAALMRWGLIPSWAKDKSIGYKMINARAETVAERPSYRTALQRRRCLVIADGFYEWQREGKARRPMRITLQSGEPFAFAGLWETWRDPEGERLQSCTIITTTPNELVRPIHDRMPVILPPDLEPLWLDPDVKDAAVLSNILAPYPADAMQAYEVSALVNTPSNNNPDVIRRVE